MKLDQKFQLVEGFNEPRSVVVIASFPGKKNRSIKEIDAIASYTDHFTRSFQKTLASTNQKLIVLAQKIDGEEEWYIENGMLICRVWDKGSPLCFFQIFTTLLFFRNVKTLLVQFEFHQFGGNINTGLFPLFLTTLRVWQKSFTLVLHQVVTDITSLSGHLNIAPNTKRAWFFNKALLSFYKMTAKASPTIVVHNAILGKRLEQMTGRDDAIVIPHGLGAIPNHYTKKNAKTKLGYTRDDFVVLYFGFLTWYKGADWLVEEFAQSRKKNIKLLIAGGISPNLKDIPHYQRFIDRIQKHVDANTSINLTGFVEDEDISLYCQAADVVVLPYRTLMSSSGPLAMILSFKKPFLISDALREYTKDQDFATSLKQARLTSGDITFRLRHQDFWYKLMKVKRHPNRYKRLSTLLRASRVWSTVAKRFHEVAEDSHFAHEGKSAIMRKGSLSYARFT